MNRQVSRLTAIFLAILPSAAVDATLVTSGSGFWATRPASESDSATWRFSNPTAADTISWTSGINNTDGVAHAQNPFGPEAKFVTAPALAGRVFAGFVDADGPGPLGSTTATSGTGSSAIVGGTLWGTNAVASWTVNANGAKGIAGGGGRGLPRWDSMAEAKDPYSLFQSQFDELAIATSQVDLFFAIGLMQGEIPFSSSGEILGALGLKASFEDAAGMTTLIDISLGASGATVTGSGSPTFYFLSSLDEGPTEIAANLTTLSDIESLLNGDFDSDYLLDAPLYIGIVLEDYLLPTSLLANGSLAQIHIDSFASDADFAVAVPEPAAPLAALLAPIALACLLRQRTLAKRASLA